MKVKNLEFQTDSLTIGAGELSEQQIKSVKDIQNLLNGYTYIECKEILDMINKHLQFMAVVVMPKEKSDMMLRAEAIVDDIDKSFNLYTGLGKSKLEIPKNIKDLELNFPTKQSIYEYLSFQRWKDKVVCPKCENDNCYHFKDGIRYKCKDSKCAYIFNAASYTFMEASKLPLIKWVQCMWMLTNKPKTTTKTISKKLDITYRTAWRMKKRVEWALK